MSAAGMLSLSSGATALAIITAAALTAAVLEWGAWMAAGRLGLPGGRPVGLFEWTSGPRVPATAPPAEGEPPIVWLGFAAIVGSVILPASFLIQAAAGMAAPGSLGVIAFAPLLCALGYAVAAERALSAGAERRRLVVAGRILFATPAWAVTVAVWVGATGQLEPVAAARVPIPAVLQATVALALVWCGQFILPGTAADSGPTTRPWGGDPLEASRGVRLITALAHHAALVSVCLLAGLVLGGRLGVTGWMAGAAAAAALAFLLRVAVTVPRLAEVVRMAPRWLVPLVLIAAVWSSWIHPGGAP